MLHSLIKQDRSYRRFDESHTIVKEIVETFIKNARLTNAGANAQPIKYYYSVNRNINEEIFKTLKWAGYLRDWSGPIEGERPTAYILMLEDKSIKSPTLMWDFGAAAKCITLQAAEVGLGCTTFAGIDREKLHSICKIDKNKFNIQGVIAIGKPIENVSIVDVKDNDIKYYRDNKENHFVPKRSFEEVLLGKDE